MWQVRTGEMAMSDLLLKTFDIPLKEGFPQLQVGDSVVVYVRVIEGKKERTQMVRGTIISIEGGGINRRFTVRRIASNGIGVELSFLTHSPRIEKIEIQRHSYVRRAKLYYMRGRTGKAARLRERRYA
jgi:large subunit ribosomal protein L19